MITDEGSKNIFEEFDANVPNNAAPFQVLRKGLETANKIIQPSE